MKIQMMSKSYLSSLALVVVGLCRNLAAATISTVELDANSLTFTCTRLDSAASAGDVAEHNVFLLHGFPMRRSWYDPLLNAWDMDDSISVQAVACDLRGYSAGASPDALADYQYDLLVSDIFALANAAGFSKFHLVGHDHGAMLGWVATSQSNGQILSYTTMSVPHVNRFSASLCGEEEVETQVVASNYFNQFALADSATRNDGQLTALFASFGLANTSAPLEFQKQLWWYNVTAPHYMSIPRVVNDSQPGLPPFVSSVRQAIPMEERPCLAQQNPIGPISAVPVLFVCGAKDPHLLCTLPYAEPSEAMVSNYTYYEAQGCGHDFFLPKDCDNEAESQQVMMVITEFLKSTTQAGWTPTSDAAIQKVVLVSILTVLSAVSVGPCG